VTVGVVALPRRLAATVHSFLRRGRTDRARRTAQVAQVHPFEGTGHAGLGGLARAR